MYLKISWKTVKKINISKDYITVLQTRIYLWLRFWLENAKVWWQRTWIWWELQRQNQRQELTFLFLNSWFMENNCKLWSQTVWVWWKWRQRKDESSASGKKSFQYPLKNVTQTRIYLWLRLWLKHAKV